MPADDAAQSFFQTAAGIVTPLAARPQPVAFRTLFTTLDHSDAICAGFDHAEHELGEEGGFEVHWDGRGAIPTAVINGVDGEVQVVGYHAIRELKKAVDTLERMAASMPIRFSPMTTKSRSA